MTVRGDRGRLQRAIAGLLTLVASGARADSQANPAAAEAIFQTAEGLMAEGRAAEACPRYEESFRLDPAGSTALRLGDCQVATGKLSMAWARYQTALQFARRRGRPDKEQEAQAKLQTLEARLGWLTIEAPKETTALAGQRVNLDGELLGSGSWGVALPLDPGEHRLTQEADGKVPVRKVFSLREGERRTEPLANLVPLTAPDPTPTASTTRPRHASTTGRNVALGLTAAGLVAEALGVYLALDATRRSTEAQRACFPTCDEGGGSAIYQKSLRSERWATVAMIGGGVLLGAGLVVYVATPRAPASSGWSAGVRGVW